MGAHLASLPTGLEYIMASDTNGEVDFSGVHSIVADAVSRLRQLLAMRVCSSSS
jgi:hypothetical protein